MIRSGAGEEPGVGVGDSVTVGGRSTGGASFGFIAVQWEMDYSMDVKGGFVRWRGKVFKVRRTRTGGLEPTVDRVTFRMENSPPLRQK